MTKCNKTLLIICLVLVFSISITFSFVSLHNSVHADSIEENLVYTLENVICPIALNNIDQYPCFFNAYISFNIIVDILNKKITFTKTSLTFAYTLLNSNSNGFNSTIQRPVNTNIVDLATTDGLDYINFNQINVGDYNQISNQRWNMNIFLGDEGEKTWCKMAFCKSANNIANIDRIVYSNFEGIHSGNEYALYNFITYYDTENNFISIGIPVFNILTYIDNYPALNTSYASNLDLCTNLYKLYAVKYNYRAYYLNKLNSNQINTESFNIGYQQGLSEGDLNGYDRGYTIGKEEGYNNGYNTGKQDGIATKGENVWSNANEFIKNIFVGIFDILSIEILPNVSLGTFVVIPLIFSVLFFIVKVAKGGD